MEKQPLYAKKLLYQSEDGAVEGNFIIGEDTLWANRKVISEIFGTTQQNISTHFRNIIQEGELIENEVSINENELFKDYTEFRKDSFLNSKKGGRPEKWYNLDAIISIGYRINSKEATQFRKWSNRILKEYMIKGFVLDDERLKNGGIFGKDYFDELLERIKEIRASERRFYQKVTDLFAECSYDYNSNSEIAKEFYATIQNKLHYAVTNQTAAEIISSRADHNKDNMGLTTWSNAPYGKIIKKDTIIAKNYLNKNELSELNNIVNMYLDYAENQAKRHKAMSMKDWSKKLDDFLEFYEYEQLKGKGEISSEKAKQKVTKEYELYRTIQDKKFKSDYDHLMDEVENIK